MIVAVAGGKGGVGKTTVALNLGRELDAVVVDGDLATPDLPRGRGPDLHDVLAGRASPASAVDRVGSVRVLPCGRSLAGARAAELAPFERVADLLDRQYGCVVVDCPSGLARDVGTLLYSADAAVLVTTPDEAAVSNAARTRDLARALETPLAGVALNRLAAPRDERLPESVDGALNTPATGIGDRRSIADAQRLGVPVRDYSPDCSAVESFARLARCVERCERRLDGSGT